MTRVADAARGTQGGDTWVSWEGPQERAGGMEWPLPAPGLRRCPRRLMPVPGDGDAGAGAAPEPLPVLPV